MRVRPVATAAFCSLLVLTWSANAQAPLYYNNVTGPMGYCVRHEVVRGGNCGTTDSLILRYRNVCTETIAVHIAIERVDGTANFGSYGSFPARRDSSFFECHATGRYAVYADAESSRPPWR